MAKVDISVLSTNRTDFGQYWCHEFIHVRLRIIATIDVLHAFLCDVATQDPLRATTSIWPLRAHRTAGSVRRVQRPMIAG
jgi:hypothetical protein